MLPEVPIQYPAAMIIYRCNQIPFRLGRWRPQMKRGVMLKQFSHIVGQDLPVMSLPKRLYLIKPVFFALAMIVGNETTTLRLFSMSSFK